jgi:hypothetical protein
MVAVILVSIALIVFGFGLYHAIETSTPLIRSDAWWFVDAWLVPWNDGTFTVADLWAKRHANHAQPLAAILFLVNAELIGLDFRIETVFAAMLASIYAVMLLLLARDTRIPTSRAAQALIAAAIVCVLFSVNAKEKLSWSLVGLFYLGHILGLLLLRFAATQRANPRPWQLAAATFATCALIDTTGVLWSLAAMSVLLLAPADGARARGNRLLGGAAAMLLGIAEYKGLYALLAPEPDGPASLPITAALQAMLERFDSAWYAALPPGAAILHPDRLALLFGGAQLAGIALLAGALCLSGHVWMWWTALRRGAGVGVAVAAGLSVFAYLTVAGILLQRVPYHGFEYVLQPRYGVFFDLFWIAPILAWACRPPAPAAVATRAMAASLCALPIVAAVLMLSVGKREIPWIQGWGEGLVRDTWTVLRDPVAVSVPCHPELALCDWPLPVRQRIVAAIQAGPYNLASPRFRARYGLEPLIREAEAAKHRAPDSAASAPPAAATQ